MDDKRKVVVRHGYSKANEIYEESIHKVDKNGIIELTFYPPKEATNQSALRIEVHSLLKNPSNALKTVPFQAEYMDLKEWFSPIPAAVSYSDNYIQASLQTERPIVNQDIEILVNCTEPLKYLSYELFGRGDVLVANTLQIRNERVYRFHFTATQTMVPIAHLIVNYVRDDGELIADSLDIEIDGLLRNFVSDRGWVNFFCSKCVFVDRHSNEFRGSSSRERYRYYGSGATEFVHRFVGGRSECLVVEIGA